MRESLLRPKMFCFCGWRFCLGAVFLEAGVRLLVVVCLWIGIVSASSWEKSSFCDPM